MDPVTLDFSAITNALTDTINVSTIGQVIGAVLAGGVGLSVFWFGGRKITKGIMRAFKGGSIKF